MSKADEVGYIIEGTIQMTLPDRVLYERDKDCVRTCLRWITGCYANDVPAPFVWPRHFTTLATLKDEGWEARVVKMKMLRRWFWPRPPGYWVALLIDPDERSKGHAVVAKGHKIIYDTGPDASEKYIFAGYGIWLRRAT